jgi:endoglycosylceramidase
MYFRGVNVVYKDPPYLPDVPYFHSNLSFVEADVDFLVSMGVNLIRLGVMWPGVFPEERGRVNVTYLERVREIVRMCSQKGVYTLLDLHQDEMHPIFCGEGVPDWWVAEFAPAADFPVPLQATPFPSSPPGRALCDTHSSFGYIWTHAAARAYQTLYDAGASDLAEYWATIAAFFAGEPGVLGGEVLDHP